jgi:uncharacterized protein YjiS (DUF1127 family)
MTMLTDFRLFRPALPTIRRRFMILLHRWVGAMIAHREREAARYALHRLTDRELRDIGIDRNQIADAVATTAQTRSRLQGFDHS